MGPLSGVKVLDVGHYGVEPVAASLLGALGANVIKVEQPERRDGIHLAPPHINGLSVTYTACNLNKRSVVLDLHTKDGSEKAAVLVTEADVISGNFRPGVMERIGLGPEEVFALNPKIVYCLFPGWGPGPLEQRPMTAPIVEAFSGGASITGKRDGLPQLDGYAHTYDANASLYAVAGMLMGLVMREKTGKGQIVEVTQLGSSLALQITRIAEFFASGKTPPRLGSACTVTVPNQAFLCQDGKYLAVGVNENSQWSSLCSVLGSEELAQERYATNPDRVAHREELVPKLEEIFVTKPSRWWSIQLSKHGVPHGYYLDFEGMRNHPQVLENEHLVLINVPHQADLYFAGPPVKFSKTPGARATAPYPGQHTTDVLERGFALPR